MKPFPWLSIVTGCVVGELIFILAFQRLTPRAIINDWYRQFKGYAVALDLLIIFIGFAVMNIILSWIPTLRLWQYLVILLILQHTHDVLFYTTIIRPLPSRPLSPFWHFWKRYARGNGYAAIAADSLMFLVMTCLIIGFHRHVPANGQILIALCGVYWILYRLFPLGP